MNTNMQSLLIIVIVTSVISGLAVLVTYAAKNIDDDLLTTVMSVFNIATTSYSDGMQYANQHNSAGLCLNETMNKLKSGCNDFNCALDARLFLQGCFDASDYDTEFCVNVPSIFDPKKTVTWVSEQCDTHAKGIPGCNSLLKESVEYCSSKL